MVSSKSKGECPEGLPTVPKLISARAASSNGSSFSVNSAWAILSSPALTMAPRELWLNPRGFLPRLASADGFLLSFNGGIDQSFCNFLPTYGQYSWLAKYLPNNQTR